MKTYPAFLVGLETRRCVIVGGDEVALQKVRDLEAAGAANVDVIAPRPIPALSAHVNGRTVRLHQRAYQPSDLDGAALVITTERDPAINEAVWRDAGTRGVLMNAADDPPHCHFFAGSVVRRGELVVAISSGGHAPALAVRLRERLERELGSEIEGFIEIAERIRPMIMARVSDAAARRELWYRLVDSDVLKLLRAGNERAAWDLAARLLDQAATS